MAWPVIAALGANFLSSFLGGAAQKSASAAQGIIDSANAYSQNLINQTNADAANAVRTANNGFAAAQAALSNLTRSIGNQQKLEAGGKAEDAITTNIGRLQDQMVRGSLDSQLRSAEQLGAVRAAAAAAGVGGTTARMLQNTLALTSARAATATEEAGRLQTYDMLQQRMGLVSNKVMSLDEGQTFAPIDYNVNVPQTVQAPIRADQFSGSNFFNTLLGVGSKNAFSIANMLSTFGGQSGGTVGGTPGFSSGALMSGMTGSMTDAVKGYGALGGGTNGFFSSGSSSKIANFQLS
jgi:hypothetical protein